MKLINEYVTVELWERPIKGLQVRVSPINGKSIAFTKEKARAIRDLLNQLPLDE